MRTCLTTEADYQALLVGSGDSAGGGPTEPFVFLRCGRSGRGRWL